MSKHVAIAGPFILLALLASGCGGGTPAAGSERGACLPGGACNTGLICL